MVNRFSITVKNDEYYVNLDREAKKHGLDSKNEFINFLIDNYFNGGSDNPELSVKQELEKTKLKSENLKLKHLPIKMLGETLKAWLVLKKEGFTLEQFEEMIRSGELTYPENNFIETPKEISKQFEPYGKTIIHSKPETKTDGLDENNFCDTCNHTHADTEPKVCKDLYCNCGIRG